MKRKRRGGPSKGQGGGGKRHPNSLRNLTPLTGPPIGNTHRLTHGARSAQLVADVSVEIQEVMQAYADVCPVRDGDGSLPDADVTAVEIVARCLKRYRHLCDYVDAHGWLDAKGNVTEAAKYRDSAERALARALKSLGLDPESRSALGLALARTEATLHDTLAEGREAWRRREDGAA
jgi:P27 family predicted phage terminase small subunit